MNIHSIHSLYINTLVKMRVGRSVRLGGLENQGGLEVTGCSEGLHEKFGYYFHLNCIL